MRSPICIVRPDTRQRYHPPAFANQPAHRQRGAKTEESRLRAIAPPAPGESQSTIPAPPDATRPSSQPSLSSWRRHPVASRSPARHIRSLTSPPVIRNTPSPATNKRRHAKSLSLMSTCSYVPRAASGPDCSPCPKSPALATLDQPGSCPPETPSAAGDFGNGGSSSCSHQI